jgi:archaellum component FlaG (FlaF/FlaG flagellin family)
MTESSVDKIANIIEFIGTIIITATIVGVVSYKIGHAHGQLDALNGKQQFKLVTNTTTQVTFERINP